MHVLGLAVKCMSLKRGLPDERISIMMLLSSKPITSKANFRVSKTFVSWCDKVRIKLIKDMVQVIPDFQQDDLILDLSASSIKVQAATIAAFRGSMDSLRLAA